MNAEFSNRIRPISKLNGFNRDGPSLMAIISTVDS